MLFRVPSEPPVSIELLLFRNVTNSKDLRTTLLSHDVQVAAFDARLIPSSFCVLCAAHSAIYKRSQKNLITKGVHSELVYNLSASRNISRALHTFGVASTTTDVLLAIVDVDKTDMQKVREIVKGAEVSDVDKGLRDTLDIERVSKAYDLSKEERKWGEGDETWNLLVNAIVTRIAVRDLR